MFVVDRYECFIENKNKNVSAVNLKKKNIQPHQNFTSFYKQSAEALAELRDTQNIKIKKVNKLRRKLFDQH